MQLTITKRFEYKDLPDMASVFHEAEKLAGTISVGKTLFFEKHGVSSEWEYKIHAIQDGIICKHSHIGWNSWGETARNVEYIYKELARRGSFITRMGFIFDWVMGVPAMYRKNMQRGTGLIFEKPDEWKELGRIAPIQPHLSDHMIGAPNALENTILGLQAGVTSIGNVSHYFTYEYPGIELERERTVNSLKAFALMGKIPGTIVHSNLDDGYGNQMHDLANLVGWAMLERYLVEDLLGANMTFSYGNLFSDPVSRIVFNMAMDAGNSKGVPGTMTFGNTIDYGLDLSRNYGALSSFSLADAICQRHRPTGHAVSAVPVSEAQRIPTPDEIVDAHLCIDMMIEKSRLFEPYINWSSIEARRDVLVACGKVFFERVMNGLDDLGVDTRHAGEIFACLKSIGAAQLEEQFGVGRREKTALRGRIPVCPTDIVRTLQQRQTKLFSGMDESLQLTDMNIIVGSTDIHDYGKEMIKTLLLRAGAHVFDLGTYVTAQEIVDNVIETESAVVAISTYNGIALSFGRELMRRLLEADCHPFCIFGGLLNENRNGGLLAEDVSDELRALGINCDNDMEKLIPAILRHYDKEVGDGR